MLFDMRNRCTIGKAPLVKGKKPDLHPSDSSEDDATALIYTNWDCTDQNWVKPEEKKKKMCQAYSLKNFTNSSLGVYSPFMFTRASMKIALKSTVVNELNKWEIICRNYQGKLWQVEVIYLLDWMTALEKVDQACWVKHPLTPPLQPDKGIPSQKLLSTFSSYIS